MIYAASDISDMFLDKNSSILTLSGASRQHNPLTIYPPLLNKRSEGTLVSHIQRYFLARIATAGKCSASFSTSSLDRKKDQ